MFAPFYLHTRHLHSGEEAVKILAALAEGGVDGLLQLPPGINTLVIAETIRFGRYKASSVPQEKLLALRELCRNRFYLIDMGSDLKRKITALLDQVFPEFESQFSTVFGKTALAVLHQYPTPEKLSRAQTGKLTEVLQAASNGRFGEWKARQLKELARDSFGIPDREGAYSTLLLMYLGQLQFLQDAAAILEKRIAELFSQFDSTLTSITGIGPVLGAVILSEIRDISRFASADKLAAYAGLNPKVKQSGDKNPVPSICPNAVRHICAGLSGWLVPLRHSTIPCSRPITKRNRRRDCAT